MFKATFLFFTEDYVENYYYIPISASANVDNGHNGQFYSLFLTGILPSSLKLVRPSQDLNFVPWHL